MSASPAEDFLWNKACTSTRQEVAMVTVATKFGFGPVVATGVFGGIIEIVKC
jgi:hypothetical protein